MMEMDVIDKGKIINQAQLLWGPALPNNQQASPGKSTVGRSTSSRIVQVRSSKITHKSKTWTGNHNKTLSGVLCTSRLSFIFIKPNGHIKLIFLIKAVEAVVDINARYQSQSVNFFSEMRPLTRDIIVSGIPWDTEVQEIIEHFEVNNFLKGKVKMKAND